MLKRGFRKFAFAICALLFCTTNAAEIFISHSDTYIWESRPDKEFSDSQYIFLTWHKDNVSIAYLPFVIDPFDYGIDTQKSKIVNAKLELSVIAIPELKGDNEDELELQAKVKLEIYAVTDDEYFDPLKNRTKVSWDGSNADFAPKHDGTAEFADSAGMVFLGEVHVDLRNEDFLKRKKIYFDDENLSEYLNFACGIEVVEKKLSYNTPLKKLKNALLIIKQISGAEGLVLCSANYALNRSEKNAIALEKGDPDMYSDDDEDFPTDDDSKQASDENKEAPTGETSVKNKEENHADVVEELPKNIDVATDNLEKVAEEKLSEPAEKAVEINSKEDEKKSDSEVLDNLNEDENLKQNKSDIEKRTEEIMKRPFIFFEFITVSKQPEDAE